MKTKIENWKNRLDAVSREADKLFSGLDAEALNAKKDDQSWSIAQNFDHLLVINSSYFPAIQEIRDGRQKLGMLSKIGFIYRFFGKMILGAVKPDRKKRMKTFAVWQPDQKTIAGDIISRFLEHQEVLKKLIADSEDLLIKNTLIASPANKSIVYSLADAFEIIVTHEERHLNQAKEILGRV